MTPEEIECGRCGQVVEDELVAKYEGTSIEEVMYWCRSCVEDVPAMISDLFDQIEDTLTDDRPEKWRDMHVSSKALFAMKLIEDGSVTGGTVGQLETLRILMATGLNPAVRVGQIWIDTETDDQFRIKSRVDGDTVKIEGQSCGIIDRDELNDKDRYEFVEYAGDR